MGTLFKTFVTVAATLILTTGASWIGPSVHAQEAATTIQVSVKNHHFQPAEVHAAANKPIILRIKNLDATPMEFESVTLRVEKVVAGNSEGIIRLRALSPGRYDFFDDFHQETRGTLVAQ
jgi:Cupredoxin-like domain